MTAQDTKMAGCPFCGGEPKGTYGRNAEVSCTQCGATIAISVPPGIFKTYVAQKDHETRKAIEAWNRRAAAPPPATSSAVEAARLPDIIGYEALGAGKMRTEAWADAAQYHPIGAVSVDQREVIIYRSLTNGDIWVIPREEFEDGRFEQVAALAPVQQAGVESELAERREWLIRKNGYFYRPNRAGYTLEKVAAGRYTRAEADREASVEPENFTVLHESEVPDAPEVDQLKASLSQLHQRIAEANRSAGEWEDLHRELFDAVMSCADPENKVCGLHPGPERDELEAVIARQATVHETGGPFTSTVSLKARAEAAEAAREASDAKLAEAVRLLEPFAAWADRDEKTLMVSTQHEAFRRARSFTSIQEKEAALLRSSTEGDR